MLERGRYLIVAPDPCGDGYVATEVEPSLAEAVMQILTSCFLTRHYRRFALAKGATPGEAVESWFRSRGEVTGSSPVDHLKGGVP